MSDDRSRQQRRAQESIKVQREKLLHTGSADDSGVCQLEFSGDWYRAIFYWNKSDPWGEKRREIGAIQERQSRAPQETNNNVQPEVYVQAGLFSEGERNDV